MVRVRRPDYVFDSFTARLSSPLRGWLPEISWFTMETLFLKWTFVETSTD
jgi:hypothetical protein